MVNFKASSHAGVHKRGLATQGADAEHVSKAEKLKLLGKELATMELVNADGVAMRVIARDRSEIRAPASPPRCQLPAASRLANSCPPAAASDLV